MNPCSTMVCFFFSVFFFLDKIIALHYMKNIPSGDLNANPHLSVFFGRKYNTSNKT